MNALDRVRGCLLGLAVGDAVGTTLEFKPRDSYEALTDMVGGGPFGLEAGQWTDDTSMAMCLASSLVECRGVDPVDQLRRYCAWWREGYWSATGECFDIGSTVASALIRFEETGRPDAGSEDPWSAGNGCIMRLAPIPIFYRRDIAAAERHAAESARTTHGAPQCLDASRLFARILVRALGGADARASVLGDCEDFEGDPAIMDIARGGYLAKERGGIRGSGYVVESLEAALWCFMKTDSFRGAVLMAANLGQDADTTAAVCGQIAGATYGESGIPAEWLAKLAMREEITELAERLAERGPAGR